MSNPLETILGPSSDYLPDLPIDVRVDTPSSGIWTWTNAQNGFRVALVHFTSDAAKRNNPRFVEDARKGTSVADFEREYNIRWQSFKGKPVYEEDFKRAWHVSPQPLQLASHLPIVRGWDFGLYPACVFTQLWPGMRLVVLKEICERGMGMERFLEEVKSKQLEWFPTHKRYFEIVDPAGFQRVQTDERTVVSLMTSPPYMLNVTPGIQVPATRYNAVRKFLSRAVQGMPAMLLDPSCKMLIQGFDGGYHYEYNNSGQLRDKPEKNEYSHPHDALQYVATRVLDLNLNNSTPPPIKQPAYGFSRGSDLQKGL